MKRKLFTFAFLFVATVNISVANPFTPTMQAEAGISHIARTQASSTQQGSLSAPQSEGNFGLAIFAIVILAGIGTVLVNNEHFKKSQS